MREETKVKNAVSNFSSIKASLAKAVSYNEYRALVNNLAKESGTTGPIHTEALANYTQLNDRRMKRWDKSLKFSDEVIVRVKSMPQEIVWLVLTESWCGDASPALPVMNKIAELNPNISLRIVLRDEHPELMSQFLTKGAMSIPKLITLDGSLNTVLGTWGPRSTKATLLVNAYKNEFGILTPELKQNLQVFYNKDKGESIIEDLLLLLPLE